MRILGKLIYYMRKASPPNDFQCQSIFRKGCAIHLLYSKRLNQVVVLKFPSRKHYISPKLAAQYLKNSRKIVLEELGRNANQRVYILNVLISDKLTKNCLHLVKPGSNENMLMLFNPKVTDDKEILRTITRALSTKFRSWVNSIKKSCMRPRGVYHETSKGTIRKEKTIEPYGEVKKMIEDLERAADIFEAVSMKISVEVKKK